MLVLYAFGHLQRRQQATNYNMDSPAAQTVISWLEKAGVKTFIVGNGDETNGMGGWTVPSLALLRGTTLGASNPPENPLPRVTVQPDGSFVPIPREQWIQLRREEQVDAMLYLGRKSTAAVAPLSSSICTEPGYLGTRLARMALAGLPQSEADRLKQFCASGSSAASWRPTSTPRRHTVGSPFQNRRPRSPVRLPCEAYRVSAPRPARS